MRNLKAWLDTSAAGQVLCTIIIIGIGVFAPPIAVLIWIIWKWPLKKKFKEFGLVKPANTGRVILSGIFLGIGLKLCFKAVVMSLLGAPPSNGTFDYLAGNLSAALSFASFVLLSAGLGEEILFRGFTLE